MRRAEVCVDRRAIADNIRSLRSVCADKVRMLAVVKADAYGHGSIEVAKVASDAGVEMVGVAFLDEAVELRDAGYDGPILLLGEPHPGDAADVLRYDVVPVVYSRSYLDAHAVAARERGSEAAIHIKIDTGMNRLGVRVEDAPALIESALVTPGISVQGVCTHFAKADVPDDPFTRVQLERFREVVAGTALDRDPGVLRHAANTAGTVFFPESQMDMVRVGIGMYGLEPSRAAPTGLPLRPALTISTQVIQVKSVYVGEGISYGHQFVATNDMTIGIIPVGYADGYSRVLSGRASALVRGERRRVLGVVCMDQLAIDITGLDVTEGEPVVLLGEQRQDRITADELAGILGTINYEVVSRLGRRLPRRYIG